ncbi:MAG: class I SAM-dependent methyltransferase [Candidatus Izemoplasmatales bacterium]|jgi:ubiquinone/menaquinone biosynthesis C-methylase UbiE|nr:class I SAM-dependent methyltransferase [Candidatus Izemoplasmatales bacterium]
MNINKPWDWNKDQNDRWLTPSEDSYFLLKRWSSQGLKRFLDLGCGRGRHAILFSKKGFKVTATDLSENVIDELSKYAYDNKLYIKCDVSDMTSLPYEDNSFDCLLAYHVIYHTNRDGVRNALKEIYRVVRNEGEVFLTFGSSITLEKTFGKYEFLEDRVIIKNEDGAETGVPHFYPNDEDLKELLKNFEVIEIRLSQNVDLYNNIHKSFHYFILAKVKKNNIN